MTRVVVVERGREVEVDGEREGPEVLRFSGAPDPLLAVGDPESSLSAPPEFDQVTEGPEVLVSKEGVTPSHASQRILGARGNPRAFRSRAFWCSNIEPLHLLYSLASSRVTKYSGHVVIF